MKSRTTPYEIQSVPRMPEALQIYRIAASPHWQCRYFIDGKYIRKTTKTENKAEAIAFAKELYDSIRIADRLDQQKHPHTFAAAARKFLTHQESQIVVGDLDARNRYEDQRKLDKDVLPFFRTMDVNKITKQTINEYLASLNNRQLSKSTRNKHLIVIRKVLRQAYDGGSLKVLPSFPTIGQDANPRGFFDAKEYKTLRDTAKRYVREKYVGKAFIKGKSVRRLVFTDDFYDFLIFAVNVFVRISDLKLLQNKHIKIVETPKLKGLRILPPDSKTVTRSSMSMEVAVTVYRRLLERHKEVGLAGADDYVFFPEHKNRAYALGVIQRLFSHLLQQTNLKKDANGVARSLYSLRHSALMFRYLNGKNFDIHTLAQNALTSVQMLEKFYLSHGVSQDKLAALLRFR
jgi:hypothetical protein